MKFLLKFHIERRWFEKKKFNSIILWIISILVIKITFSQEHFKIVKHFDIFKRPLIKNDILVWAPLKLVPPLQLDYPFVISIFFFLFFQLVTSRSGSSCGSVSGARGETGKFEESPQAKQSQFPPDNNRRFPFYAVPSSADDFRAPRQSFYPDLEVVWSWKVIGA